MIAIKTQIYMDGVQGNKISDFLLNCTDEDYRKWWNGTHLQFHTIKRYPGNVGNIVFMDEFIGNRRVKMMGVVIRAVPGKEVVWQIKKIVKLPVWVLLKLEDREGGVKISHTIKAGFNGIGKILDPFLRMFFTREFAKAMDEHAMVEFPKLRDMLN